jgi:hypothetical protein
VESLEVLWQKVILPAGHAKRGGLPPRLNQQWFEKTFCGGKDMEHVAEQGEEGQVWSHVSGLTMFDPLTLLAAHPTTLERFFEVERKT